MGTKNKSAAQVQKSQNAGGKKGKKAKTESSGPPRAEIIVSLNDEQALKSLKGSKAIMASDVARQCGVKISAANAYLKDAAHRGKVTLEGGNSGHRIYKLAE